MRLHIFGASGSGVTTLGSTLAGELGINYFDSDDYFWLKTEPPFEQRRDPGERNELILHDLNETENWILGGSIIGWEDILFPTFDLAIFLYLPPSIRIDRLRRREFERYGDVIYNDSERVRRYEKFMTWAIDYDHNTGIAN